MRPEPTLSMDEALAEVTPSLKVDKKTGYIVGLSRAAVFERAKHLAQVNGLWWKKTPGSRGRRFKKKEVEQLLSTLQQLAA